MKKSKNLEIIQGLLFRPSAFFTGLAKDPPVLREFFLSYGIPLMVLGAAGRMVRMMNKYKLAESPLDGMQLAGVFLISLVAFFVAVWLGGTLIGRLGPAFGSTGDRRKAIILSICSFTPFMLAQPLAALHPMIDPVSFLGLIYTLWLFGMGLSPLMQTPRHKTLGFTLVGFFILFGIMSLLMWILPAASPSQPAYAPEEQIEEAALPEEEVVHLDEFGLPAGELRVERGVVGANQTLSHILGSLGFSAQSIDRLAREMQEVFNPRRIRRGNAYHAYYQQDATKELSYLVYEISDLEYLLISFRDSIGVSRSSKELSYPAREAAGLIRSSLWNALMDQDLHPELAIQMARVLAWSVDFHRLEAGDRFKVLYTERHAGDRRLGVERVDAVYFIHRGREVEGFRFTSDTLTGYFDREGNNLRKVFLRAPIEYVRISSRYSRSRLHPIHGDRRPHLGTDYAAPHGTPILAVGDGVVTRASYSGGNGNYVRIRHNAVYETQYLHMSRFAAGIRPGTRVSQGEVIGYVGSTGLATGPHVCFRFWKNGQQVDHLRLDFPSGDPLPEEYRESFQEEVTDMQKRLHSIPWSDPV